MPARSSGLEWSKSPSPFWIASPGALFSEFLAVPSGSGVLFINVLSRGLAMRERLLVALPDASVYLFADMALCGMPLDLRFGGIVRAPFAECIKGRGDT